MGKKRVGERLGGKHGRTRYCNKEEDGELGFDQRDSKICLLYVVPVPNRGTSVATLIMFRRHNDHSCFHTLEERRTSAS